MNKPSDELNLHFHVPRELLERHNSLHFHLHLSDEGLPHAELLKKESSKKETPRATFLSITVPQHQSNGVHMLATSAGNFICAFGREVDTTGTPPPFGEVVAEVFHGPCPASIPPIPTSGATPAHFNPLGLPSVAPNCNWAFHPLFSNLLPCPSIPSGGNATFYMIQWANYGTSASPFWIVGGISCFTAILGPSTDCDDRSQKQPAAHAFVRLEGVQPRQCRLFVDDSRLAAILKSLGHPAPDTSEPIVLEYEPATSTAASPEWTGGCNRRGRWRLRVTQFADSLIGLLTLSHVAGMPLKSNLVWRGERWELTAANRLDPFRPVELCNADITCVVEPN